MIERKLNRAYEVCEPVPSTYTADEALAELEARLAADPDNTELWMEKGLMLAGAELYREAGECYARAISIEPFNGILYRHWAHRMLSQWRFADACAAFTIASRLIPENWDVWYHLGLSHFLLGDYDKAAAAYQRCLELSTADDEYIAVCDWYYMTERRRGNKEAAEALLEYVKDDAEAGDNEDYFQRVLMYKGKIQPEDVLPENLDDLSVLDAVTRAFGVSNFYRVNGDVERADAVVDALIKKGDEGDCYFAFGYLAALADKMRRDAE